MTKTRGRGVTNNTKRSNTSVTNNTQKRIKSEIDWTQDEINTATNENVLESWVKHTTKEYHHFQPKEAEEIRNALLRWYRKNRRKLPWRGDAPPYDGSTAGYSKKKQLKLDGYFSVKEDCDVIPVSGYSVWVSEIMLQQTRVEAVIPYYLKWMKSFPTVQDLANASEEEVNSHWAGLGFYRRARLLHSGSKYVVQNLSGTIPSTVPELLKINGIGRYTASAIASIAFGVCVPVVDGNVCRVLSRLRGIANHIKAPVFKDNFGFVLAEQIVSAGDGSCAGEVNQALMEIGATYCAPHGSGIDKDDPLREYYLSTKLGRLFTNDAEEWLSNQTCTKCQVCDANGVENILNELSTQIDKQKSDERAMISHACFPIDPPKKPKREEVFVVVVFYNEETNKWFMKKRPEEGLLAGQWEFPSISTWEYNPKESKKDELSSVPELSKHKRIEIVNRLQLFSKVSKNIQLEQPIVHIFSHVRHTMYIEYRMVSGECDIDVENGIWMSEEDMKTVGITSGVKKILRNVKKEIKM